MRKFIPVIVVWLIATLLLVLIAITYGKHRLAAWGTQEVSLTTETIIEYQRGTTLGKLSTELEAAKLIDSAAYFKMWVKLFKDYTKFQAGKYRFEGTVSPESLVTKMVSGDVYVPVVAQITIPEGFTMRQIFTRLIEQGIGDEELYRSLASDQRFLLENGIDGPSLEGFLFPATYTFTEVPSGETAIKKMVDTFWERLPKGYEQNASKMGLSFYEAIVFASLIELETPHDDERSQVSEVIWRRLNNHEPLGIDAALIYGIEDYAGDIKRRHLEDKDNLYNTRIHRGLPPTPIGSPSVKSLEAVLTPTEFGYNYYVLDRASGNRHHFSKTLEEHNSFVRKLSDSW